MEAALGVLTVIIGVIGFIAMCRMFTRVDKREYPLSDLGIVLLCTAGISRINYATFESTFWATVANLIIISLVGLIIRQNYRIYRDRIDPKPITADQSSTVFVDDPLHR